MKAHIHKRNINVEMNEMETKKMEQYQGQRVESLKR